MYRLRNLVVVLAKLSLLNGCLDAEPDEAIIPAGEQVQYRYQLPDGRVIFGVGVRNGDTILIDGDVVIPANAPEQERTQFGGYYHNLLWPSTGIPYEFDPTLDTETRQNVLGAMEPWRQAGITFRARTSADTSFVRITTAFHPNAQWSCAATIGMQASNTYWAGSQCRTRDYVHEWGHVIGLFHEHCRNDRDQFVITRSCGIVGTAGTSVGPYDFGSIMHYDAFDRNDDGSINYSDVRIVPRDGRDLESFGFNEWPSAGDFLAVQSMYGVAERPLAPVSVRARWAQCYGRNHVTWSSPSSNVQYWEAQKKPNGTATWTQAYSGSVDSFTIDVTVMTRLRVRACNWLGCSAYTESNLAVYYPECYVPY
jgi:hypothetical protein